VLKTKKNQLKNSPETGIELNTTFDEINSKSKLVKSLVLSKPTKIKVIKGFTQEHIEDQIFRK